MNRWFSITLLLVGALAAISSATAQQNGSIIGVVKDAQTGDALPGANVILAGTSLGASTDVQGKYTIRNIPAGTYTLRAAYVGYKTRTMSVVIEKGATLQRDLTMEAVAIEGETVVITAQAAGQNEAINQQLSSNQITSVVSSARIQELPDANAAESVGRLPGVSVLRSGGEGNQIVIRGLQPKYNTVSVDGVRMTSSNPNDRSVDLSMISPLSLEGIEVSKSVTPDVDADALGGSVNFRMREAKSEQPGLAYSFLVQGGYNGLSAAYNKYNNYRYVGSVDGRFFESSLGVFAQADIERRNLSSNEFGAAYDHLGNSHVEYITNGLNLNDVARDRQRENGTLVMDYRLPEGKISFSNFFSTGATDIQNRGQFYNVASNLQNYTLAYSNSTLNLITNALTVEHEIPIFHATLRLSHAYSETKNPDDWTVGFQQAPAGLSQFINKPNLYPTDIPGNAVVDPTQTFLGSIVSSSSFSRERALTASLDLETTVNVSDIVTSAIKFGGKYRYQTRSYVHDQYTGQGFGLTSAKLVDSLIATHFPSTMQYANTTSLPVRPFLDPDFSYGGFLNGDYTMSLPLNYGMVAEMAHFVRFSPQILSTPNLTYFHDSFNSTSLNYDGNEGQSAFYLMATIQIGPQITLIPGVRYQDLRRTYTAPRGIQNTASALGGPYYNYDTTLTVENSYWFPDVILRYKPLPWFDLRLSYSNTISYPDYNSIVPRIDVPIGNSISYNNYALSPTRSTNYDAYASFYDNSIGLLTAGVFLKRIDDLIYPWNFYVSDSGAIPYYPPNLSATVPTGAYNVSTFVNDRYRIDDWGVELDWQTHFWYLPHPFDGLVLNVNYTHIFSKARYPYTDVQKIGGFRGTIVYVDTSFTDRLLTQPNNIVNLSLGFDYEGFSARVSMLYQADVFAGSSYWDQLRSSTSAYTRWDLSVKQNLPWFGLQIYGDLNNLNAASDQAVINGAAVAVPQSQQSYGLTGDVGIRWQL
jgi:TonB-dependent receptor